MAMYQESACQLLSVEKTHCPFPGRFIAYVPEMRLQEIDHGGAIDLFVIAAEDGKGYLREPLANQYLLLEPLLTVLLAEIAGIA